MALPDFKEVLDNLKDVKHKILILSGKGGVGKSTVAFSLASELAIDGYKVGILDVDIHGPSIPNLVGNTVGHLAAENNRIIPIEPYPNMKVVSIGYMLNSPDDAVIWRGPLKYNMIKTFLKDVEWGELDYLIIDLPPGTGDESLSICQMIGKDSASIIVTTPQRLSISDVRKAITFCHQLNTPIVGVVENMRGFVCPHCGKETDIFSRDGGREMAESMGVNFLGALPINVEMMKSSDEGTLYFFVKEKSPLKNIKQKVLEYFKQHAMA